MLDYEWGNPTPTILSGEHPIQGSDHSHGHHHHHHQFVDHYSHALYEAFVVHHNLNPQIHSQPGHHHPTHFHHPFYPPPLDPSLSYPPLPHPPSVLSLPAPAGSSDPVPAGFAAVMPKTEPFRSEFPSVLGLNLGGRTYFPSSADDDQFMSGFYRNCRTVVEPRPANLPRCQVEGCNADLTHAKHYHRRHKVCEFHSKAATVVAGGLTQRFCQQCSRFHLLSEFDNGKRSCRRRLADHNRRRRKSSQPPSQIIGNAAKPSSYSNIIKRNSSPPPSSSSSVIAVPVPSPRISLHCSEKVFI